MKTSPKFTEVIIRILVFCPLVLTLFVGQTPVQSISPTATVGLVVNSNGVLGSDGWNNLAYQGLLNSETDLGVEGTVYSGDDYANQLGLCAASEELCIATGWGFYDNMVDAATNYPGVKFAYIDGDYPDESPSNFRWVTFEEKEVGYLAGALAGKMTTSDVIGAVGGPPIPPVVGFLEGYENGAQCANNHVTVLEKYAESFNDPGWGNERAMEMMDAGADVIFGAGGATGEGAILWSAINGVKSIGVDTDQWITKWHGDTGSPEEGHEYILTSAMKRLDNAVKMSIEDYLNLGSASYGGHFNYGIGEDGVGLAPYHEMDSAVSSEVRTYLEVVRSGIANGTIPIDDPCVISIWTNYTSPGSYADAFDVIAADTQAEMHAEDPIIPRFTVRHNYTMNEFVQAVQQGWGPDLYVGSNDQVWWAAESNVLLSLDSIESELTHLYPYALEGLKFNEHLWGIPFSSVAVGLYYRSDRISNPPSTTAELLELLSTDGRQLTAAIEEGGPYWLFGFWKAFGGQLMTPDGLCIADQGGFEEAMSYLLDLQDTNKTSFMTDYSGAMNNFSNGSADMLINGPWALDQLVTAIGGEILGVVPLPDGPTGLPSQPLTGFDAIFVNNSFPPFVNDILMDVALNLSNQEHSQYMTSNANVVPVRDDIVAPNDWVSTFREISEAGIPRPRKSEVNAYWGPFHDQINNILQKSITPRQGISTACKTMNENNEFPFLGGSTGEAEVKLTYTDGITYSNDLGNYRIYVEPGWTGKITPLKSGFSFIPMSRLISTPVSGDVIGLDFTPSIYPGTFAKKLPANAAVNQPSNPTLKWGSSSNLTQYQYCVDATSGSTCTTTWKPVGLNLSVTLSGLTAGKYYWQVRAKNANGFSYANNGTWWNFTVPPKPGSFNKTTPANNTTGLATSLTLKWGASSSAAKYEYCIDTTNNNSCNTSWKSTGTKLSAYLTSLIKGKKYYWMVRAVNAVGTTYSNNNTWWNFTIKP